MFRSKKLTALVTAGTLLAIGGLGATYNCNHPLAVHAAQVSRPAQQTQYQIQSANYHRLRLVKHNAKLWSQPYNQDAKAVGNVNDLAGTDRLVHLNWQAKINGEIRYYQIGRQGKTLGWIKANDLRRTREYILPYRYVSQFWPSHADDACEAAALMMALSVKGKGMHIPLRKVVKRIPRSASPERGYTKDPFKLGTGASIYPAELARVTWHQFHIHAKSITGASKHQLISDVEHGNPVVFEGSCRMRNTRSDHSLVLLGYRRGYFYFADPYSKKYGQIIDGWVSTRQFMRIFTAHERGARAMLLD